MRALRIGFLFKRPYRAGFVSIFPKAMQALAEAGVVVDVIACNERLIDLSTVRVEHDLYVLRQIYGVDLIESDGQTYVVDMSSIPGFKGVPDASSHLASYFRSAAERAAAGRPLVEQAVEVGR